MKTQPCTWQTPGLTLMHRVHKGYRIENVLKTLSVMKRYWLDKTLFDRGYVWCGVQEGVLSFYHVGEYIELNPESMCTKYRPVAKGIKKMNKKIEKYGNKPIGTKKSESKRISIVLQEIIENVNSSISIPSDELEY